MKWPFVSRALFERVEADLRRSEEERKALLDHLLGGEAEVSSKDSEEIGDPATGALALTASQMKAIARKAMYAKGRG